MGPAIAPSPATLGPASPALHLESFFFFYRMAIVTAFLLLVLLVTMLVLVCTRRCRPKIVPVLLLALGNTRD